MSGDKAPLEILLGVDTATKENFAKDVEFTLVGDENVIKKIASEQKIDLSRYVIKHTDSVLTMEDDPMSVMKDKKDSSLALRILQR